MHMRKFVKDLSIKYHMSQSRTREKREKRNNGGLARSLACPPAVAVQSVYMNNDLQSIKDMLHTKRDFFAQKFHVQRFGIFGSIARGSQTAGSDADILVEFTEPIGLFAFVDLEDELAKLLQRDVDLVTKNALKPVMKDEILEQTVYV